MRTDGKEELFHIYLEITRGTIEDPDAGPGSAVISLSRSACEKIAMYAHEAQQRGASHTAFPASILSQWGDSSLYFSESMIVPLLKEQDVDPTVSMSELHSHILSAEYTAGTGAEIRISGEGLDVFVQEATASFFDTIPLEIIEHNPVMGEHTIVYMGSQWEVIDDRPKPKLHRFIQDGLERE
jgi:hypothetical protein